MTRRALFICTFALLAAAMFHAQDLPDLPSKIDGYKVENAKVVVTKSSPSSISGADVVIRLDDPRIANFGLLTASVEIRGEMFSNTASGEIERMSFHDVEVNGVPVDLDDVRDGFKFRRGENRAFAHISTVSLGPLAAGQGLLRELTGGKGDWTLTGIVFVFGKFTRWGLTFKRVIPVRLELTVKDPLL